MQDKNALCAHYFEGGGENNIDRRNGGTNQPAKGEFYMTNAGRQEIKCNVFSCKHSDKARYCTLQDIHVGHEGQQDARSQHDTVCASFQADM